jgi:superfamily I DNA/RNA helicase
VKTRKIYGGPGCGKTYAMLGYFEKELKDVDPEEVAFLTFTRAARLEAISRTKRPEQELPYVRTIHALCYRQLKLSQASVVSPRDLKKFGEKIGVKFSGARLGYSDDADYQVVNDLSVGDRVLQVANHLATHQQVDCRKLLSRLPDVQPKFATWLLEAYTNWKRSQALLDYTDLLTRYLKTGSPIDELKVVFVDEAQDLSPLQWAVVHKLSDGCARRYLAGDDDQAIFEWAGASPAAFNAEHADDVEVLPVSHRLSKIVWSKAHEILTRIAARYKKKFAHNGEEGDLFTEPFPKPEHFNDQRTFLLYRNHYRGFELARQLMTIGVPFFGLSPLDDPEVVLAIDGFRRALTGEELTKEHVPAIVRFGTKGHVNAAIVTRHLSAFPADFVFSRRPEAPKQLGFFLNRLPNLEYLTKATALHGLASVLQAKTRVMSIHQSKGQEADTVLLDVEMSRRTFEALYGISGRNPDEEHRVFYVGTTRAKRRLIVLEPSNQFFYFYLRKNRFTTGKTHSIIIPR